MSRLQFTYKTWHFHVGYEMEFDLPQPPALFLGKNRIRKFQKKSGFQIPNIFGQILRMDSIKYRYMVIYGILFEIFTKFSTFVNKIYMSIGMNSYKIGRSYIL